MSSDRLPPRENLWIGSTDLTEVSTRCSLRRLLHTETRHVPSRATSAPSSRSLAFPRPFSHARGEGVRLCLRIDRDTGALTRARYPSGSTRSPTAWNRFPASLSREWWCERIAANLLTSTTTKLTNSRRPGPDARDGLSLSSNSLRSHGNHSRVNVPGLPLRFPADRFRSPFGPSLRRRPSGLLPGNRRHRRSWPAAASAARSARRLPGLHFPSGLLHPSRTL
jgi:hypothetical protein